MGALRKRLGLASRRVLSVVALAALLLAAGSVAAAARVTGSSDRILAGVRIDGLDVGGMTREQAVAAVQRQVEPSLRRQVTLVARGKRWTVTPARLGRTARVEDAVDRALDGPRLSWLSSFWHRITGRSVRHLIRVDYAGNDQRVAAFVRSVAKKVEASPVDASIKLVDDKLQVRRARPGYAGEVAVGAATVAVALQNGGSGSVKLPIQPLRPDVSNKEAGMAIGVDLSTNRLTLYNELEVVKTYSVATGQPGFPTPTGSWKVMNKIVNPSWHNPAPDDWGADMPLVIPPGPGNPLGTRAMPLNASGILIHGTFAPWSIGTYASHGCIRLSIPDVEDLFPRVPIGTPVFIYRS